MCGREGRLLGERSKVILNQREQDEKAGRDEAHKPALGPRASFGSRSRTIMCQRGRGSSIQVPTLAKSGRPLALTRTYSECSTSTTFVLAAHRPGMSAASAATATPNNGMTTSSNGLNTP